MNRITDTVKHLIIINVVVFVCCQFVGDSAFALLSLWFPENQNFQIWQIISHMFMHHKTFYLHIISNMFGLWMFGTALEQIWGRNKFLFFYFSCGLAAVFLPMAIDYYNFNSIISPLIQNGLEKETLISVLNQGKYNPEWLNVIGEADWDELTNIFYAKSLGASGAVMGLLAAYGVTFPNSELMLIFLPIPIKAKYFIPLILSYEIYSGFAGGNSFFGVSVAHFAHVGGALAGLFIAWYWKKNQFKKNRWDL